MEYLKDSRKFFKEFRDSHLRKYYEVKRHYKVGGSSGYGRFYKSDEVRTFILEICAIFEEDFVDLSIPDEFATPRVLVESWISFQKYLQTKNVLFEEIEAHLIAENKKSPFYSKDDNPYDGLPEPFKQINEVRLECFEFINHILDMDDVLAFLNKNVEGNKVVNAASQVVAICRNFHKFCNQLRSRYNNRRSICVRDEYDVQDLLHSILKLHYDDIRDEEYTPSYAGRASRIDFLIANEEVAVEVKMTRKNLKDKQVGEQLIIDVARYKVHPKCRTLICFVYDPKNLLKNPHGIESDLSSDQDGIQVRVVVSPQ